MSADRTVVALGNFDGFHRGHQAVLSRAMALALAQGLQLVVATFDPHPVRYFRPHVPGFLLTTISQRTALFSAFGADRTVAIPFDEQLAALSPDAFVKEWLSRRLNARTVVTGANFKFGFNRSGDTASLRELCTDRGIIADVVDTFEAYGGAASSTRVREHLTAGEIECASALMTRPYVVQGSVERRLIGGCSIPVISLAEYLSPMPGLYSALLSVPDARPGSTIVEVLGGNGEHEPCIRFPGLPAKLTSGGRRIAVELRSLIVKCDHSGVDRDASSFKDYHSSARPLLFSTIGGGV